MGSTPELDRPTITVIGLGPAGPELMTRGALDAIDAAERRYVRTERHAAAAAARAHGSFDHVYESADSMDDVYPTIVAELVSLAQAEGDLLYAVPGSPRVAEQTVDLLCRHPDIDVVVLPALSFVDLAWVSLGVDPIDAGVRIIDGHRFSSEAAGERGPLLVAQCDRPSVMADIKLSVEDWPSEPVTVISGLGHRDERIYQVPFGELDRVEVDHLTSIYIPTLAAPVGAELVGFHELVRRLRSECEWDKAQSNKSLKKYLLEECYELIEAIDELDPDTGEGVEGLEEELGDVLFQVYFHAVIASEMGWFDLSDVARGVHEKLRVRHPHVFGDADPNGDLVKQWDEIKAKEKGRTSVIEGVPQHLPALAWTQKLLKRARSVTETDVFQDAEPPSSNESRTAFAPPHGVNSAWFGEFLFAVVEAATVAGIDPEDALRLETTKFVQRVKDAEAS